MIDVEENKRIVRAYYEQAFGGEPEEAARLYQGVTYVQHNPEATDGREAFAAFVRYLRLENPEMKFEIKRILGEGDIVVTHSHLVLKPGDKGRALADFFRLADGKVVEHWDVIQEIPEIAQNGNGMF